MYRRIRIVVAIELLLLALSLSSNGLATATEKSDRTTNNYPPEYVREYMKECQQTSMAEGIPEEDATTLCSCTLDKFQAKYTLAEFEELTEASETDAAAADTLTEVGQICFDEILFEE